MALRAALPAKDVAIRADLGKKHGFASPFSFPRTPELVLAALVPTRGLFSRMTCISSDDLTWSRPDVAVEWQGQRYIVDVCGKNETTMRVVRKVETYLYNANHDHTFVGLCLLMLAGDGHDELDSQYEMLLKSFSWVFGGTSLDKDADTTDFLKPLIGRPGLEAHYGRPEWTRIKEIEVSHSDTSWQCGLTKHALWCFGMSRSG
jgi:hypothetical protein